MVRSLDQIASDLESLATATKTIDQSFKELYNSYLKVLGKAVRQQLILATYHLCTQVYPEAFLKLSVSQRAKVQSGIRKTASQGKEQIDQLSRLVMLEASPIPNQATVLNNPELLQAESHSQASAIETGPATQPLDLEGEPESNEVLAIDDEVTEDADNISSASGDGDASPQTDEEEARQSAQMSPPEPKDDNGEEAAASEEAIPSEEATTEAPAEAEQNTREATELANRLSAALSLLGAFGSEPLSPIDLAKRHVLLERQLRVILQTISNSTNYLLKQTQILPDLPEVVIAAAAEAEAGESVQNTPNLLNVLVEIGSDRTPKEGEADEPEVDEEELEKEDPDPDPERSMTHLVAVSLRLADIEFADTHTALWRNKLQEALSRLKRLSGQYQKLKREKSRADAEHAWRATWFEE